LWELAQTGDTFSDVWPEYNHQGDNAEAYFGELYPRFAGYQALLVDGRSGAFAARARTIPFDWDGTLDDLPHGIDTVGMRAVSRAGPPTALSALAAEVAPPYRGLGLSGVVLQVMAAIAASTGLSPLVAPVRPSWKDRYPLVPIERYTAWVREDGLPFDPWLRVHARLGGKVLRCEPRSMQITAPVRDWESWTRMPFPEDGEYVFPGGLTLLNISGGSGSYWEPNVWVQHDI
jgi:GNAT superfamily N-acetyltransferase